MVNQLSSNPQYDKTEIGETQMGKMAYGALVVAEYNTCTNDIIDKIGAGKKDAIVENF